MKGHGAPKRAELPGRVPPSLGVVAIAASTGGPNVLARILRELPGDFPAPIVVAQHISPGFAEGMAGWLNSRTELEVVAPVAGMRLAPGRVYLASPERNMRIGRGRTVEMSDPDEKQLHHPSCDLLLFSVAQVYGRESIGVILTGMGNDGVAGIRRIKEAGGTTIAQDSGSSLIFGMPRLAIESGCVDTVLPAEEIAAELVRLQLADGCSAPGAGALR